MRSVVQGTHLEAGANELDNVAVVAGAQDEDLAAERLGIAGLVLCSDLVRENLHGHYLDAIAYRLVNLSSTLSRLLARRNHIVTSRARLLVPVAAAVCVG